MEKQTPQVNNIITGNRGLGNETELKNTAEGKGLQEASLKFSLFE